MGVLKHLSCNLILISDLVKTLSIGVVNVYYSNVYKPNIARDPIVLGTESRHILSAVVSPSVK